ncbi:hypothetical protein FGO68_gene2950 [Halteria grandinella]|uniref:Uncharacterized protein n=1 Tax=Halteria grandinella TaxID=5974 RepID=A0A8J8NYS0_HALGN|nr:hypothetical protein FGO68_gene2950 [Halteria grandinella]
MELVSFKGSSIQSNKADRVKSLYFFIFSSTSENLRTISFSSLLNNSTENPNFFAFQFIGKGSDQYR